MKNNDLDLISEFIKGAINLFKGLYTIFKQARKARVTLLYPENKPEIPEKYRGFIALDPEKCIGCKICAKVCPALKVLKYDEITGKLASIDLSRCISCGNCVYNCPKNALNVTKQYELATNVKKDLLLEYGKTEETESENLPETQS